MPGVISTRIPTVHVRVINFGESEVALHPRQCIGSCESYYDLPQNSFDTKTTELRTIHKISAELTKTLQDTVNKASPEMTESERERWKNLVWRFHGIFATSKADLGKTSLVRHKINTGNAVPIRIPARRLPLGKRKTEQEVHDGARSHTTIYQPMGIPHRLGYQDRWDHQILCRLQGFEQCIDQR